MRTVWICIAVALARPAFGGCDPTELGPGLSESEAGFEAGNPERVAEAFKEARLSLRCQTSAVLPRDCARLHRAAAYMNWLAGNDEQTVLSLRAMRHADPALLLPGVGPNHPLGHFLIEAEETRPAWTPSSANGPALIDGIRSGVVPIDQPYVQQLLDESGAPRGAKLVARLSSATPDRPDVPKQTKSLRWAALGLGAGSVALYGGAWGTRGAYQRAVLDSNDAAVGSSHAATNGLSVASATLLSLAAGAVVTGELTR